MTKVEAPMNDDQAKNSEPFSFQISQAELGPLFVDLLKLKPGERSPLKTIIDNYKSGSAKTSKALKSIAGEDSVKKAAAILAQPEFIMENRHGGGAQALNFFTACNASSINQEAFAVVSPSYEGSFLIQLFDSSWLYLAWWLNLYAANPTEPVANYIPPPTRLEPLIYILHAVDCYRRCSFISQLSFTPTNTPSISIEAYSETLKQSIGSADLRWLLPSFLALVPNLDLSEFDEDPANFEPLAQLDFLLPGKGASDDDAILGFGEAGRAMGVEFYRSWFQSIGFEISIKEKSNWKTLHRGFLAPTGLANHLILMEAEGDSAVVFNHQAMTRDTLEVKLARLMADTLSSNAKKYAELPEIKQRPAAVSNSHSCTSCGSLMAPDQKFCPNCGAKAPTKEMPKTCKNCNSTLKKGAKFCPECGTKSS